LGGRILLGYLAIALLGIVASISVQLILSSSTSSDDDSSWLLVGGVTSSSANFRIQLADQYTTESDATTTARLVLSLDPDVLASEPVSEHNILVSSGQEDNASITTGLSSVHSLTVEELDPQTKYFYGVVVAGTAAEETLLEGRFATPALEGTRYNFSMATAGFAMVGSTAPIFDIIQQDHPDLQLFLHLGDVAVDPDDDARTSVAMLSSPPQASLYRSFPTAWVWSDRDKEADDNVHTVFPHFPLAAGESSNTNSDTPLYQAFTMGTVRFLLMDLHHQSKERSNNRNSTSFYFTQQQEWLFQELSQADQYDFVVLVSSQPWMMENGNGDDVDAYYAEDRRILSDFITESLGGVNGDGPQNLLMITGSGHDDLPVVAMDDGSHTYFGSKDNSKDITNNNNTEFFNYHYSFPVFQSAPLDRMGGFHTKKKKKKSSEEEGIQYSEGCWAGYDLERTHQYSIVSFEFPSSSSVEGTTTNNNSTATSSTTARDQQEEACIVMESFRVDEWSISTSNSNKRRFFSKRLCGKFFQPSAAAAAAMDAENATGTTARQSIRRSSSTASSSCRMDTFSDITIALLAVAVVLSAMLGGATFLVLVRDTSDSNNGGCCIGTKSICATLSILVAWGASAIVILYTGGVFLPTLDAGYPYHSLRVGILIALVMILFMMLLLFVLRYCCCCCKKQKSTADSSSSRRINNGKHVVVAAADEDYDDPVVDMTEQGSITNQFSSIGIPSVIRQQTSEIATVKEEDLPQGIILTGGKVFRQQGLTGRGVRVAVIDSGVDAKHPGFGGKVTKKRWLRSGTPLEEDDHGTHVAGTIHMMAPDANLHDYRVFGRSGALRVDEAIAKAIREATDSKCQVINMSLGGPFPNPAINSAVEYAAKKGVVMVCAAGNEGDGNPLTNEISFPASYEECISIAAVSKKNGFPVASFSNSNPMVDYAGIGVDVLSFQPGGGFQQMSGTSMACPHVAGLVACLMTDGKASAQNIRKLMDDLAIDIDAVGFDNATGVGFVTGLDEESFDQILPRR
jgi:major intracellular serine protease